MGSNKRKGDRRRGGFCRKITRQVVEDESEHAVLEILCIYFFNWMEAAYETGVSDTKRLNACVLQVPNLRDRPYHHGQPGS